MLRKTTDVYIIRRKILCRDKGHHGDTRGLISYGAKGDSSTDNATSIQKAIAAASSAGGGVVKIPAATKSYLSGPLTLSSKVNLLIEKGAVLQMLPYGTYPMLADSSFSPFIGISSLTDVAISGAGTIDGNGNEWWVGYRAGTITKRPGLILVTKTTRMSITGVHIQNAPNVHLSFHYQTSHVTVQNIHIKSPGTSPNTDGADVEGLHFLFSHDSIEAGDDNIAFQPSHDSTGDITVQDCFFGVGHGLSFGSWMQHGVNGLVAIRDTFVGTTSGIRFKAGRDRGGLTANISYTDFVMTNVQYPLYITSYYPSVPADPIADAAQAVTATTPWWKGITITNLTSTSSTKGYRSILIEALPEAVVDSLTLTHVHFTAPDSFTIIHSHNMLFTDVTYNGSATNWFGTKYDVTFRSSSSSVAASSSSNTVVSSSSVVQSSSSIMTVSSSGITSRILDEGNIALENSPIEIFDLLGHRVGSGKNDIQALSRGAWIVVHSTTQGRQVEIIRIP